MKRKQTTQFKNTPAPEKGHILQNTTTAVSSTLYLASKAAFKGGAIC